MLANSRNLASLEAITSPSIQSSYRGRQEPAGSVVSVKGQGCFWVKVLPAAISLRRRVINGTWDPSAIKKAWVISNQRKARTKDFVQSDTYMLWP